MTDIPGVAHNLVRVLEAMGVEDSGERVQDIGQEIFNLCDGTFPFALARLAHLLAKAGENKTEATPAAEEVDGETVDEPTTTDGKDA